MARHQAVLGDKITQGPGGALTVPDRPIVLFIEGDGTGPDIWRGAQPVLDAAVAKAYGGKKQIVWQEILAGAKAFKEVGSYLPEESLAALRDFRVAIKGPLTTPVGGGFRSLNVTLRQVLDLYACIRPVRYYQGVPSPLKEPALIDMVVLSSGEHRGRLRGHRAHRPGGDRPAAFLGPFLLRTVPRLRDGRRRLAFRGHARQSERPARRALAPL